MFGNRWYDLYRKTIFGYVKVADNVLPTPALMDATFPPHTVDAYESSPADAGNPAVWRLRDDKYDKPGTVYVTVSAVTQHEEDDD